METKQKTALITGGAGYLGSHLSKVLHNAGWKVVIYDKKFPTHFYWEESILGDILDYDLLTGVFENNEIDVVYHLAGRIEVSEGEKDPTEFWRVNVGGTTNVIHACKSYKVNKLIFSSTAGVYFSTNISISEDECTTDNHVYGNTKLACERAIQDSGLHYVIFRYFNLAGADPETEMGEDHVPETHLIPAILQNLNNFYVYGNDYNTFDGTCIRDYVHVSDVADAHLNAFKYLEKGNDSTIMNLGYGAGYSVMEIIQTIEMVTGKKVKYNIAPRRHGDPESLVADINLAKKQINFRPKYDISEIVKTCYEWEKKNKRCG